MVEVLAATATAADTFSRRMVHQCLEGVATLLGGHIRGRAPAGDCLTAFTEAVGPAFVFKALPKAAASCTNPKILQESLTWMAAAMEEFGVKGVDMKALVAVRFISMSSVPATSSCPPCRGSTGLAGMCPHAQPYGPCTRGAPPAAAYLLPHRQKRITAGLRV